MSVWNSIGNGFLNVGAWFTKQVTPDRLAHDIQKVQTLCVETCGFLPLASVVAGIFAAGNPALAAAIPVANAICGAINAGVAQKSTSSTAQNMSSASPMKQSSFAAQTLADGVRSTLVALEQQVAGKTIVGSFLKVG